MMFDDFIGLLGTAFIFTFMIYALIKGLLSLVDTL